MDNTGYLKPHQSKNEDYIIPHDSSYSDLDNSFTTPSQSSYQKLNQKTPSQHLPGIDNPSYEQMDENHKKIQGKKQPTERTPILDKEHKNQRNFEDKHDYANVTSTQSAVPPQGQALPQGHYMDMTGGAVVDDGYLQISH